MSILSIKSYQVGLAQEKAYQLLYAKTKQALAPFHLIPSQWALLGLIHDAHGNMTFSTAAKLMGVENAYITKLSKPLLAAGYITVAVKSHNRKNRYCSLTGSGEELMITVEPVLRKAMQGLFLHVSPRDLLGYVRTIHAIPKLSTVA